MRRVEVVEYRPSWPALFRRERDVLQRILGDIAAAIHHIGSTAVPGLAAKPIIDILLEVTDLAKLDHLRAEVEAAGYESKGEFGIAGRRYFRKGGDDPTHHLHAFARGDANVIRYIAFRDFLRADPAAAHEYGELKRQLAQECHHDVGRYCDGKDAYVKRIERLALSARTAQGGGAPGGLAGAGDLAGRREESKPGRS